MEREEAARNAEKWQSLARAGRKVEAIKELRTQTGKGLKPAKDEVEAYLGNVPREQLGASVKTTIVQLGGMAGYLTIVDNGHFAIIQHTRTVAMNVPSGELLQELADVVAGITCVGPTA